jgi:DNA-binding transcriptional LysR family regulator
MDVTLARTFVEIVAAGTFMLAAERLHLTQTAVSARVRSLEHALGRQLFVRSRAGAALTPAGEQFLRHARTLVQVWEQARRQVAIPPGTRAVVTVGCEISLWDPLMIDWLVWMRRIAPHLALRTEVDLPADLLNKVAQGAIDIAVVYSPQQRPGLRIELLIEEKLVLVTTSRAKSRRPAGYVYVDWGREFAAQHHLAFPDLSNAAMSVGLGPLGREYLLEAGGSGYFRLNVVRRLLKSGRLHVVPDAPVFLYPAYAVYAESADPKVVMPALAGLRHVSISDPRQRHAKVMGTRRRRRASARE